MDVIRDQLSLRWRRAGQLTIGSLLAACMACEDAPAGEFRRALSVAPGEGGSPVSLDSALTLFRGDLAPIDSLEHAERSMERLVATFARTIERSDTAALRAIVMSRREFAYLYYPTSPFARAPTKQEPGLAWFLHLQFSQKGATRLLAHYGGKPVRIVRNECTAPPRAEGRNLLWDDCVQTVVIGSDTAIARLFGGVYGRDGRFKIFSYANDL